MKIQLHALRIIFFGTGKFASTHLYMLLCCSIHKIIAVFTQESKLCKKISDSPIIQIAKAYNITLFQTRYLTRSNINNIIKNLNIDIIIVVSYGYILSKEILNIPRLGCINVHGSLLPRWRGAAPIQRAIEAGDSITGISIIQMDSGIDTGNILYSKTCKILPKDTSYTLSKKLAQIGSIALIQIIEKIIIGTHQTTTQNSLYATYAHKLKKQEARINWKDSAIILEQRIRAFNPWPIVYFQIQKKQIKIWEAKINNQNINNYKLSLLPGTIIKTDSSGIYIATRSGTLILTVLQISGKKKTSVKNILNAYQKWFCPNTVLK